MSGKSDEICQVQERDFCLLVLIFKNIINSLKPNNKINQYSVRKKASVPLVLSTHELEYF